MNKPTKKRRSYNTDVIKALSKEYGFSERFIRMCVNKEKDSITADTVRAKYNEMASASLKAIEQFKKKPI